MTETIRRVALRRLRMPLHVPYKLSYRTFEEFEPFLMLDEPICSNADIERAATLEGVGLCKLKLKRFGGLAQLGESLDLVRSLGMEPVLGDGLGSEVTAWMEACVARSTIRNAGEFNGFLKSSVSLFDEPLKFEDGAITMPAGYRPNLDPDRVEAHTTACEVFDA